MLDLLIDSDRIDVILGNYEEMWKGLGVYEFVFNSFLKRGEVEKGLNIHQALVERGLVAKIVDCNKILKGLCMGIQIGVASDFFDVMLRSGPSTCCCLLPPTCINLVVIQEVGRVLITLLGGMNLRQRNSLFVWFVQLEMLEV